jgi:ABC-type transport system involved in multi-copper enzyme maturation permease subunit
MSTSRPFATLRQLTRDTFRQACACGIFWMMLGGTAVCVLLCLSVGVSGDVALKGGDEPALFLPPAPPRAVAPAAAVTFASSGPLEAATLTAAGQNAAVGAATNPDFARHEGVETLGGRMTLAFGAVSFPVARERGDSVRFLELLLAAGVAGTLGIILALVWTAGFLPTFLEPQAASVLLAKPVARWQLFLGKYLGVLTFVAFQATVFVLLTWLALGLRTGVWDTTYWWCIPLLLVQFAVFYSFSALLAVLTRSTVVCVFGAVLFWLVAWGLNYGCVAARGVVETGELPASTLALTEPAYWIAPKPLDAGVILFNALDAGQHFSKPAAFRLAESGPGFSVELSVLSSLLITVVLLALSVYEFGAADY